MLDDSLSVAYRRYLPPDPEPERPRQPALWDGRPFPGKCDVDGCRYQATSAYAHWDGGAPGVGNFLHRARCDEHRSDA